MATLRKLAVPILFLVTMLASLTLGRFGAYLVHSVAIAAIGALGLNLLTGFCGQISFAQGALLGVGAYTAGNLGNAGWGIWAIVGAGVASAMTSLAIGLPALRLRGLYYAIATLAAQFILEYLFKILEPITNGISGLLIQPLKLFGRPVVGDQALAVLSLALLLAAYSFLRWLMKTNVGRAMLIVRENELVAKGMGIDVARTKIWAFVTSGFITGVAGAMIGFTTRLANPEAFQLSLSVDQVAMIIVGGQGTWAGPFLGAAFVVLLPEAIQRTGEAFDIARLLFALRDMAFGLLIILFLLFEPRGLSALLRRLVRWVSSLLPSTRTSVLTVKSHPSPPGDPNE